MTESPQPPAPTGEAALLDVRGLSRSFRGLKALSDYDLALPDRTIHGVIGPNGAGKTTLFHVLSGFLRPSAGVIRFDGTDITGRPAYAVARLGIVRTFAALLPKLLAAGLDPQTPALVAAAATTAHRHYLRCQALGLVASLEKVPAAAPCLIVIGRVVQRHDRHRQAHARRQSAEIFKAETPCPVPAWG